MAVENIDQQRVACMFEARGFSIKPAQILMLQILSLMPVRDDPNIPAVVMLNGGHKTGKTTLATMILRAYDNAYLYVPSTSQASQLIVSEAWGFEDRIRSISRFDPYFHKEGDICIFDVDYLNHTAALSSKKRSDISEYARRKKGLVWIT